MVDHVMPSSGVYSMWLYSQLLRMYIVAVRLCVIIEREMFPDDYPITYYLFVTENFTIQHLLDMVSGVEICLWIIWIFHFVID